MVDLGSTPVRGIKAYIACSCFKTFLRRIVGREESGIVILGTESASHIRKLWCKKSFD